MKIPDRTFIGIAGIGAACTRRIRLHGLELLRDRVGILAQADGVAVGLRHLAAVESRHFRRRRQQHVGLDQDAAARAFEIAEQPLAIGDGQARVAFEHRSRSRDRLLVAFFLINPAQLLVASTVAAAETLDRLLDLRFEVRLAAVDVIEAPRDFARDLDMRDLVLADRHVRSLVQQDVGGLQQRVAEEAIGREVLVLELLLLILVRRHALQPAERRDHRQQQMQLGMLGHARLDEHGRGSGIEPGGEPVDDDFPDVVFELARVFVAGRQRVDVRDEEVALVLVLQLRPVLERPVVVAEMQRARGAHPGQDTSVVCSIRAQFRPKESDYYVGLLNEHDRGVPGRAGLYRR